MSLRSAGLEKGPHSPFHEGVHFGRLHELLFIIVISCESRFTGRYPRTERELNPDV